MKFLAILFESNQTCTKLINFNNIYILAIINCCRAKNSKSFLDASSSSSSNTHESDSAPDSSISNANADSVLNRYYRKAWDQKPTTEKKALKIHNHPPIGRKETIDDPTFRSSLGSEVDRENSEVVVASHAASGYKSEKKHHHRHHHHHKHRRDGEDRGERHSRHHRYQNIKTWIRSTFELLNYCDKN